MKNIQIILNAVLSKNIFRYILVDKDLKIVNSSDGIAMYLGTKPEESEDVLAYLPELVGSEQEIQNIFKDSNFTYILETVHKNDYYINITVEHYDTNIALVLMHNISDITLSNKSFFSTAMSLYL